MLPAPMRTTTSPSRSSYSKEIIYDYKKVLEYFTEEEYEYIDFESAYNIQTRKKYGFSGNNKDLVLLTKKKK